MRLGEPLELFWDRDAKLCVDLSGRRPMLRIRAELEKGFQDRLLPMTPEFAEFLLETPESEWTGRVFSPKPIRDRGRPLGENYVSLVPTATPFADMGLARQPGQDSNLK